ncbi:MAG: FhaA domain-containing protein [Egibacteraceae bacterium]
MSILRDFEKRLEGAVEGFFARAFRSGLQPVELAKALQRYAANYQQVGIEGVFIPNVFRFTLAEDDVERFAGFSESLARELADVVRRTAEDRGWQTKGPVRIEVEAAPHVLVGTYELRGRAEAGVPATAPAAAEPDTGTTAGTIAGTTQTPGQSPSGSLRVIAGGEVGARFSLSAVTVIGRLPECEVTLDDPSVSRKHARITLQGEQWTVKDLGSTNGMWVNGAQVGQSELRDGDRLDLGGVKLRFSTGAGGRRSPTEGAAGANGRGL